MNLWLRLLGYLLLSWHKPADTLSKTARWPFRVWLADLDINGHVNNGRFLELMDLGRFDFFWRSSLRSSIFALQSVPILGGVQIRYRLPLELWQPICLETELLGFEENWMVIEQRFIFRAGVKQGAIAAIALCKCGFYDRKARALLDPRDGFKKYGVQVPQGDMPQAALSWRTADLDLKARAKPSDAQP